MLENSSNGEDSEEMIRGYIENIGTAEDVVDLRNATDKEGNVAIFINDEQIQGRTSSTLQSLKLRLSRIGSFGFN